MSAASANTLASTLRDFLALAKPRITLMVVLTAAGGIWLAPQSPDLTTTFWALVATGLVVASANCLNCWIERESDGLMARTRHRPLPAGRLSANAALLFGGALGVSAIPLLAYYVNPLTALLGAVALIWYVWIYTPMKRRSGWALVVGAVPGAMPPLMGWTAATGELGAPGLVLFGIMFLWQLPHFMAISMFREREYTKAGIRVFPAERGRDWTKLHAALTCGALVPVSLLLVPLGTASALYFVLALAAGLGFFAFTLLGLRPGAGNRWARQLFLVSLLYLPVLFTALAVDAQVLR